MTKTITVKGTGRASAKPDHVEISMSLESAHRDYQTAMELAGEKICQLDGALCAIGFPEGSVKTADFDVGARYDRVKDRHGNYESVFSGYEVTHHLKLAFDFDMKTLARTLSAIAGCVCHPQLSVAFTVKDGAAVSEELLRSATAGARKKAQILCDASGVRLGSLLSIDYNWGELDIYSHTRFSCCDEGLLQTPAMNITPEDIDLTDSATFVWEII